MRGLIIGTAGHIDHGKSALVHALTGTDPDRLKEEKARGITIDLGFAHVAAGGQMLSFVDVPGHERFVRHMVAGVHGIDAALLVIAADESVMPQTREHFHVCRLLGISAGVIALTKCDVADAEMQALAELEARELVKGSFLEGAPIVRVSARTRLGLETLVESLTGLTSLIPERSDQGVLRLPIDRVFTLRGFGTVVTGTLVSGSVTVGEGVDLLPSGRRARVRGLQIHGQAVERATAGHRTAVNLAGVEVEDVQRGEVLGHPETLRATTAVDVALTLLPGQRPPEPRTRVRVHAGAAEALARVAPIGGEGVTREAEGLARLRLERPLVLAFADRLVLRSYSPAVTIGGARVLDPSPARRRRRDPSARGHLERLSRADVAQALRLYVEEAGLRGADLAAVAARTATPRSLVAGRLAGDAELVVVGRDPGVALSRSAVDALASQTESALERYHRDNPLRQTMPLEELRGRVFAHAREGTAEHVLQELSRAGRVRLAADGAALAGHRPTFSAEEGEAREALLAALQDAGLAGLEPGAAKQVVGGAAGVVERVARALVAAGGAHRISSGVLIHSDCVATLAARVRERWPAGALLDIGVFKEMTGLTRKHAIPLLELLDALRVTRRAGTARVVLSGGSSGEQEQSSGVGSRE